MLDVEMICPDLLFDTNLSTSENLNVEVANFLSKEAKKQDILRKQCIIKCII